MTRQRVTDKLTFKLLWLILGLLGGLCVFFIKDWFTSSNMSNRVCAEEIHKLDKRVIVVETILPEIRNFMSRLNTRMENLEKK
jgi:hypothetical protein